MRSLPNNQEMPETISLEKPAKNLAGLSLSPEVHAMKSVVVGQWSKKDVLARLAKYGIYPIRQMLFFGPPGNGKTSAAQWLASALGVSLYRVRCEMIVSSYHGVTAQTMRKTLDWLETEEPCVVLFDEVETLFQSRELAGTNCSQERHAAMATLWQALDRWSTPQLFIFATNMESKLDPAMLSRFETKVFFGPPTKEQSLEVLRYWREIFHDSGSDAWGPELESKEFSSFRELWQNVSDSVRQYALAV